MSDFIRQHKSLFKSPSKESGWVILRDLESRIKSKIESIGIPLRDWDIQINYGIKTGFNEAFIIDESKRNELIKNCPKAVEIIRPILRGREIHKYWIEKNDQYLLFIPWHFPLHNETDIIGVSTRAENDFKEKYPAVYRHLMKFKTQLELRNQAETGIRYEWYALQRFGSNYWPNFYKPKIIYPEITKFINFYLDTNECYFVNNKCFIISGRHLEYLTAFFNSSIFKYCFINNFPELMGGTRELRKVFFDLIPVKTITDEINEEFKNKVDQIQKLKNEKINTMTIEREIDEMLFNLYELTLEEREVIGFIEI
jgi:adenine-specific DNA-methyltransferase